MQRKPHVRPRPEQEGNRRRKSPPGSGVTATGPRSESHPEAEAGSGGPAIAAHSPEEGRMDMVTESVADELRAIPTGDEGAAPGEDAQAVAEAAPSGPVFIGPDAFWAGFQAAHEIPGHLLGLDTLLMAPGQKSARPASDAIYRICERTPSMHFLIVPGSQWVADAAAIAMYAVPLTRALRTEISAKKAVRRAAKAGSPDKPGSENHAVREYHAPAPGEAEGDA